MDYCCFGLRNLLASAGERGLAAIVELNYNGVPRVRLQSRGVSFDEQSKLRPSDFEATINICCTLGIVYCPFCGNLLEDLIAYKYDVFLALAKLHRKYSEVE